MSDWMEVSRKKVPDKDEGKPFEVTCVTCHRLIVLNYNGGELDQRNCCDSQYALEYIGIEVVRYVKGPTAQVESLDELQAITRELGERWLEGAPAARALLERLIKQVNP